MRIVANPEEDLKWNPILIVDVFRLDAFDEELHLIANAEVSAQSTVNDLQALWIRVVQIRLARAANPKLRFLPTKTEFLPVPYLPRPSLHHGLP